MNYKNKDEKMFVKAIDKCSKIDYCLLCRRKMDSACNSHVVPQFILREIAENGRVSYGYSLSTVEVSGLEKETGISNAHTFRLICRECDAKQFKNYENPNNIVGFDNLDLNLQKIILCEMALKTHLAHISMKYRMLVYRDMASSGELGKLEQEGKAIFAERIDINEHLKYINELRKSIKTNKNPFLVIFNKVLDYKTKLSTQTIINFNFDINGNQIFDPSYISQNNVCRYFYLMIIPYKNQTRVLFYIEKKYVNNVSNLVEQFNLLTDDDKLHFLFVSLVAHDQQFYMAPSYANSIFKKDKKIVKLYTKSEKYTSYQSNIKNFKKFNNYLLKEFNV